MKRRPLVLLSLAVIAAMAAISAWAWGQLPDDAQMPIHWGIDGQADGFAPKGIALALLPLTGLLLLGLFAVLPSIEPRRTNFERSMKLYSVVWIGVMILLVAIHAAMVAVALGNDLPMDRLVVGAVGLMFVAIGNFLPKTRSTFLMGIRTPWTLTSERSWAKTHRLGGFGFVALGLLMIGMGIIEATGVALAAVVIAAVVVLIPGLVIVSYLAWRDDPDRTTLDGQRG